MGLFKKQKNHKNTADNAHGDVANDEFVLTMKRYSVGGMYNVGIPANWNFYNSDRFRAKTEDGKTQISITSWIISNPGTNEEVLKSMVLPLYDNFVTEGGYEPYDDFFINANQISKSFKVDNETQYHLTLLNDVRGKNIVTSFIIRDIGKYDPEMRATLLCIANTMQFV